MWLRHRVPTAVTPLIRIPPAAISLVIDATIPFCRSTSGTRAHELSRTMTGMAVILLNPRQ
jgi:hypothetical protein